MLYFSGPVARLADEFAKLPGIGPKTAQRLALHILNAPPEVAQGLARALVEVRQAVRRCSGCCNLTDEDPCAICRDPSRNHRLLCVVEEPRDVIAMEKARGYRGLYHVLHGAISPMEGIGPEQLTVKELLSRLADSQVEEVILAANSDVEGETTALYLARLLKPLGVKVTRIAHGIPVGADLEYADAMTLNKALEGRGEFG
ncbi:recombination mediator RecR [Desulforamulus hydrothermalis]|uniref:Recombination protein RecR n=1 Tax=Desulforamulus hydrothermalis Lam5 = DSM 18033 TaxID=1121428 RepID=K8DZR9_9FIRM|nr:recombination mediator RecR [Desulforamulus hydrothermalis]CCO08540.1 Recombination protein recR [Desulforamulus hydrothermalis Lam5 = DSM 18033]SHH02603.1 DNA replication and repair protein RecR [Desulforamulus hydrothermalis Lam5 = DSM 18033]